ncbi:hypothetical protein [Actinomyces urogenitalis]|uniref:hypothetical protein n=1 Tax=Actinomyces urogenitalis TaxID=103621 RepID=UPI00254B021D|nr:hypothetical protein [Actinomyces urogenitalis]MDK8237414.1 hypothetical protein [Actinomyces urogenitalis]WOO94211.1 hypothetical protein R3I39_05690 [Actinomyces urogenitalis]
MVIVRPLFMVVMWLIGLVSSVCGAVAAHRSRPGSGVSAMWAILAVLMASPIFLAVAVYVWLEFLI